MPAGRGGGVCRSGRTWNKGDWQCHPPPAAWCQMCSSGGTRSSVSGSGSAIKRRCEDGDRGGGGWVGAERFSLLPCVVHAQWFTVFASAGSFLTLTVTVWRRQRPYSCCCRRRHCYSTLQASFPRGYPHFLKEQQRFAKSLYPLAIPLAHSDVRSPFTEKWTGHSCVFFCLIISSPVITVMRHRRFKALSKSRSYLFLVFPSRLIRLS